MPVMYLFRREILAVTTIVGCLLFVVLDKSTSTGGFVFLGVAYLAWDLHRGGTRLPMAMLAGLAFFLAGMPIANLVVAPIIGAQIGRVALPCKPGPDAPYAALTPLLCALGRNYVRPEVDVMLKEMARDLRRAYPDMTFPVLDAGPMYSGMGGRYTSRNWRKRGWSVDLAYFYQDAAGKYVPHETPSPIGFWGFQAPPAGSKPVCADDAVSSFLRWDMAWFQAYVRQDLTLDERRTAAMLRWLTQRGRQFGVKEVLIEPHMAKRLGVTSPLIRFQGCLAARHDDHIHVEVGR